MAGSINKISPGAVQPNPSGSNVAGHSYISPGAVQPDPNAASTGPVARIIRKMQAVFRGSFY